MKTDLNHFSNGDGDHEIDDEINDLKIKEKRSRYDEEDDSEFVTKRTRKISTMESGTGR